MLVFLLDIKKMIHGTIEPCKLLSNMWGFPYHVDQVTKALLNHFIYVLGSKLPPLKGDKRGRDLMVDLIDYFQVLLVEVL